MPTKNRASILRETLSALGQQTTLPDEVVVIDDGSTDDTAAVCGGAFPFRLRHERLPPHDRFCPARPRNHGLAVATGDIAILLDTDVLAGPTLVQGHLEAHRGGEHAVIGYTYGYPTQPDERTPEKMCAPPAAGILDELPRLLERDRARWQDGRERYYAVTRDLERHPAPWQLFWTNNVSVPRGRALEIGGFDEAFVGWGFEDVDFAYRLRERVRYVLAREAWGVHYPHSIADVDVQRAGMLTNVRRFIEKCRSPEVELAIWDPINVEHAWPIVRPILERAGPPQRFPTEACTAWLGEGRVLAWGPFDGVPVAAWLQPFRAPAARGAFPGLGLLAPWPDRTFDGALVHERWSELPVPIVTSLVAELLRVAGRVAFLLGGGTRFGSRATWQRAVHELDVGWTMSRAGELAAIVARRTGS